MFSETFRLNEYRMLSITIAVGAMVMLVLFSSCSGRKKELGEAITERDSLPVMDTRGVVTLVSDSGIIRYRVNAEEWKVYDRKSPSYWAFEKGVYVEKFDSLFQVEASIEADTAYYYDKQKLWKLMSNVHIRNLKGEKFDTDLLFWDQNKKKVYSDRQVRIEQPDQIIYAVGFESDEQMTKYKFFKTNGIFFIDEETGTAQPIRCRPTRSSSFFEYGNNHIFVGDHGFLRLLFGHGDCVRFGGQTSL